MQRSIVPALVAFVAALAWQAPAAAQPALAPAACPTGVPATVTCWRGRDANGAFVLVARPADWSGVLIVHSFGGPRLAAPTATTTDEDLQRFAEFVVEGHAWVSTSRRQPGFAVRRGAEDADMARRLAIGVLGAPRVTIAHGQSWGANVAAKLAEVLNEPGADGRRPYDGVFLTNGVIAGGTRAYDMRMDLRAAFQVVCGTLPRPDEPSYHLGIGLPAGTTLPRAEFDRRVQECTGIGRPVAERTPEQRRALSDLAAASRIPERTILGHLVWATYTFQDIARRITDGRSAFGNEGVRYRGTSDDAAFNARVPRFAPDPEARRLLAEDSDPTGRVAVPVLTMHGIHDETAFVENESAYREAFVAAGTERFLRQVFVDEGDHSKMSPPLYPAAIASLLSWIDTGTPPTPADVAQRCEQARARHAGACRVDPAFRPRAWAERVNPR
jgi:hypothetical protein